MKQKHFVFILLSVFTVIGFTNVQASGDVLWFSGHSGFDSDGHEDLRVLLEAEGANFQANNMLTLPLLHSYSLIFLMMPGAFDENAFFSTDEKSRLNEWLSVESHRLVLIGEFLGYYPGYRVMEDLFRSIGNPITFVDGVWDAGCLRCRSIVGQSDPLTTGLNHVCYAYCGVWDPSFGVPLVYPEDRTAPGPFIISNGTDIPCIIGISDSNSTTDLCGQLGSSGDTNTKNFHRRLYNLTCSGEEKHPCCRPSGHCIKLTESDCLADGGISMPGTACNGGPCVTTVDNSSWSAIKVMYR